MNTTTIITISIIIIIIIIILVIVLQPTPIDGKWSTWVNQGDCSQTCGTGQLKQKRTCDNPSPEHGGKKCQGDSTQNIPCNINPCPIHGGWSNWINQGDCDKTCGTGQLKQKRTCNNPSPENGGNNCLGDSTKDIPCNTRPCPIDGGWGDWNKPICDYKGTGGNLIQTRKCDNPIPKLGGKNCIGDYTRKTSLENKNCLLQQCNGLPNTSVNHSPECLKAWYEMVGCDNKEWISSQVNGWFKRTPKGTVIGNMKWRASVTNTNDNNYKECHVPVAGGWGDWTNSVCDNKKTGGNLIQTRKCDNPPPKHGGTCDGDSEKRIQNKDCLLQQCNSIPNNEVNHSPECLKAWYEMVGCNNKEWISSQVNGWFKRTPKGDVINNMKWRASVTNTNDNNYKECRVN
jgi:hemicentin